MNGTDRFCPLLGGVECQDDVSTICIGAVRDADGLLRKQDVVVGLPESDLGCLGREARDKAAVRREGVRWGSRIGK